MTLWKREEKRAIKEYEKIIKGNEAKILAIYQALPYQRLAYSPKDLQKLLNSLKDQSVSLHKATPYVKRPLPEDAPFLEGRIEVEIYDEEKGKIMLGLQDTYKVIGSDTARRLAADLLKVMRENNIIQSPQDKEDEGKDTRICACCKRNLPEDVDICFQCVGYSHFEPKKD